MLNFVYHPDYSYQFPDDHRFPMSKFFRLHRRLTADGVIQQVNLVAPEKATEDDLAWVHDRAYVRALANGTLTDAQLKRLRLPWTPSLAHRSFIAANGTLTTCRLALEHGLALHMAGGTHHSQREGGAGFCVFNDMAYAATRLLASGEVERVLVFDLDVHQGDGTANILRGTPGAFTCSVHCQQNYPHPKAQSDLDVPVPLGMTDADYLAVVEQTLSRLLDTFAPDLVIYDAGADVHVEDQLGKLAISTQGMADRDDVVFDLCFARQTPMALVIGGGYREDREALADIHAIPFRRALTWAHKMGLRLSKTVA